MNRPLVTVTTLLGALSFSLIRLAGPTEASALGDQTPVTRHVASLQQSETSQPVIDPRLLVSDRITVRSARHAYPWINLSDGRDLPVFYEGTAGRYLLKKDSAHPLSLAAADFDEDGVPDLVCGYAVSGGGALTLHRGNVDSIFPNTAEAEQRKRRGIFTDAPFLPGALAIEFPTAPDFLGAGDFDADGHWDIVAATRGSNVLHWLSGDGRGGFGPPRTVELGGAATALLTEDVNRRDGLTDVVVAVSSQGVHQLLTFESPYGALRGEPEKLPLPAEASSLAAGQLDDQYPVDVVVAARDRLLIVHGRDRKLSWSRYDSEVPAAVTEYSFAFAIRAVAVGDFIGGDEKELALLAEDGIVHFFRGNPTQGAKTTAWEAGPESIPGWQPAGEVTLPAAARPAPLRLTLATSRISSTSKDHLLVIDPAGRRIDIVSGEGFGTELGAPALIESLELLEPPITILPMRLNEDALDDLVVLKEGPGFLATTDTQPVKTFVVNDPGDQLQTTQLDQRCDIKLRQPGNPCTLRTAVFAANLSPGFDKIIFEIEVVNATTVIQPSETVFIDGKSRIDGTSRAGKVTLSAAPLSLLNPTDRRKGGNHCIRGLALWRTLSVYSSGNRIEGNFIGTDGTNARGNTSWGVHIISGSENTIGGASDSARNVISGNGNIGVYISEGSGTGNHVQGNTIGLTEAGNRALPNGLDGVRISGASGDFIGGTLPGLGNVISGNNASGIEVNGANARGNLIQRNFIGTDAAGNEGLGNRRNGIEVWDFASGNTIGGTTPAAGNVISGNVEHGVTVCSDCAETAIQRNFIGTNAAGGASLAGGQSNGKSGMSLDSRGALVGGTNGANVIAFNTENGISVFTGVGNQAGNRIISNSIFSNRGAGIQSVSAGDVISSNSIFANGGLGIDLATTGVTPNDLREGSFGGNNNPLNFPLLTLSGTSLASTLNSSPTSRFRIEFFSSNECDPSGNGEGQTFLSAIDGVQTDASGNASFNATIAVATGQTVTATATLLDGSGNLLRTSEFSPCVILSAPADQLTLADPFPAAGTNLIERSEQLFTARVTSTLATRPQADLFLRLFDKPQAGRVIAASGLLRITTEEGKRERELRLTVAQLPASQDVGRLYLKAVLLGLDGSVLKETEPVEYPLLARLKDIVVNSLRDLPDRDAGDGLCDTGAKVPVTDEPECTFRAALQEANTRPGKDTIRFQISGRIQPASALPEVTEPVIIDGRRQGSDFPAIELNGRNAAGKEVVGLQIRAGESTVTGLAINEFSVGILLTERGNNTIQGNFIGTDPEGTTARPNQFGIVIRPGSNGNTVGGERQVGSACAGNCNLVSGNKVYGIAVLSDDNKLYGNFVGTDRTGSSKLGNEKGVSLDGASRNRVGGVSSVAGTTRGNLISGNSNDGVSIRSGSFDNVVEANLIGTDLAGRGNLGNEGDGIEFRSAAYFGDKDSSRNRVGGLAPGTGNVIAFNGMFEFGASTHADAGIMMGRGDLGVPESTGNAILGNSIFSNKGMGIDLDVETTYCYERESLLDREDGDSGPNNLQNFPILTSALTVTRSGVQITEIRGLFYSAPSRRYRLEFFSNQSCNAGCDYGQGAQLIGSLEIPTDGKGNASVLLAVSPAVQTGWFITATATLLNADGTPLDTSEFSQCRKVESDCDDDGVSDQEERANGEASCNPFKVAARTGAGTIRLESSAEITVNRIFFDIPDVLRAQKKSFIVAEGIGLDIGEKKRGSSAKVFALQPGASVTVTLFLPPGLSAESYYNFGPTPGDSTPHWYEFLFDGRTGAEIQADRIVLHFVDGQRGDHDLKADGIIVTLGGPVSRAGTILYFPFNQSGRESFTGIAVSNFSERTANIQFQAYGPGGLLANLPKNNVVLSIGPQRQLARLGSEIFGADPALPQSGWIQLFSDNAGIGSFFQIGSTKLDQLDGSVAFTQQSKKFYFTRVFEGATAFRGQKATTLVSIANPNAESITLKLSLFGSTNQVPTGGVLPGQLVAQQTRTLAAFALLSQSVAQIFGQNLAVSAGYIVVEVTQGAGAVGFQLIQLPTQNSIVGLNASFGNTNNISYSAQLAHAAGAFFTSVKLVNTSAVLRTVTLKAVAENGTNLAPAVTKILDPGSILEQDVNQLFSLAAGAVSVGSLRIEANGDGVIGDVIFGDPASSRFAAGLPLQTQGFTRAVFSQVANVAPYFTGLALYNPGTTAASVTIEVYSVQGVLAGQVSLTLKAGERVSKLVSEFLPATAGQAGGYLHIRSTAPLIAQQLFGDSGLNFLSAVPPTVVN